MISPAAVKVGRTTFQVPVTLPSAPGRYRLTITVHDGDGVAYDAATQALLPSLIVRVTGDFDGAIQATPTAQLEAGTGFKLGVRVVNLGIAAWGHKAIPPASNLSGYVKAEAASVVGTWIPLSAGASRPDRSRGAAAQRGPADRPRTRARPPMPRSTSRHPPPPATTC